MPHEALSGMKANVVLTCRVFGVPPLWLLLTSPFNSPP